MSIYLIYPSCSAVVPIIVVIFLGFGECSSQFLLSITSRFGKVCNVGNAIINHPEFDNVYGCIDHQIWTVYGISLPTW